MVWGKKSLRKDFLGSRRLVKWSTLPRGPISLRKATGSSPASRNSASRRQPGRCGDQPATGWSRTEAGLLDEVGFFKWESQPNIDNQNSQITLPGIYEPMASSRKYGSDVSRRDGMRLPVQAHLPLTGNDIVILLIRFMAMNPYRSSWRNRVIMNVSESTVWLSVIENLRPINRSLPVMTLPERSFNHFGLLLNLGGCPHK